MVNLYTVYPITQQAIATLIRMKMRDQQKQNGKPKNTHWRTFPNSNNKIVESDTIMHETRITLMRYAHNQQIGKSNDSKVLGRK